LAYINEGLLMMTAGFTGWLFFIFARYALCVWVFVARNWIRTILTTLSLMTPSTIQMHRHTAERQRRRLMVMKMKWRCLDQAVKMNGGRDAEHDEQLLRKSLFWC